MDSFYRAAFFELTDNMKRQQKQTNEEFISRVRLHGLSERRFKKILSHLANGP